MSDDHGDRDPDASLLMDDELRGLWGQAVAHPDDPGTRGLLDHLLAGRFDVRNYHLLIEALLEENARLRAACGERSEEQT